MYSDLHFSFCFAFSMADSIRFVNRNLNFVHIDFQRYIAAILIQKDQKYTEIKLFPLVTGDKNSPSTKFSGVAL